MNYEPENLNKKIANIDTDKTNKSRKILLFSSQIILILLILALIVFMYFALSIYHAILVSSPTIELKPQLNQERTSLIYDQNQKISEEINLKNKENTYTKLENIPTNLQNAFLSIISPDYWNDNADSNLTKILLNEQFPEDNSNPYSLDCFIRKIQMEHATFNIENSYGKNRILEYYLNTISLGNNIIGVKAASKSYFNKSMSKLSLSECAVLAAIAKNPTEYNPVYHPVKNKQRQTMILTKMKEQGTITSQEYQTALHDNVFTRLNDQNYNVHNMAKTYFTDALISQLVEDMKKQLGYTETQAYNSIYNEGLKIYSTQDQAMQKICDSIIQDDRNFDNKLKQVSFVLIDQHTGQVKAISGGRKEFQKDKSLNRATNTFNQPGTVFSPLASYLPALDANGMTLASVFDDSKYLFPGTKNYIKNLYSDSYKGLTTLRTAISDSINVISVKTLEKVGSNISYDYLLNLGFTSLTENSDDGKSDNSLNLSLGKLNKGITNLELTSAYSAIANSGLYNKPILYSKVTDKDGNIILDNSNNESRQVIKKSTAWLLTNAMEQKLSQSPTSNINKKSISTAGINGYSDSFKDLWFVGYTPYFTAGIWVGFDDDRRQENISKNHIDIWNKIISKIHKNYKFATFKRQQNIVSANICTKCGNLAVDDLCAKAVGGSTKALEYFDKDNVPNEICNCHAKYNICKNSGMLAGDNCPSDSVYSLVYLQKASDDNTADSPLIVPKYLTKGICDIHN